MLAIISVAGDKISNTGSLPSGILHYLYSIKVDKLISKNMPDCDEL
jgi:hypothetical protein